MSINSFEPEQDETNKITFAQADLSLCWAHRSFCWFCHALAHFLTSTTITIQSCPSSFYFSLLLSFYHLSSFLSVYLSCLFCHLYFFWWDLNPK